MIPESDPHIVINGTNDSIHESNAFSIVVNSSSTAPNSTCRCNTPIDNINNTNGNTSFDDVYKMITTKLSDIVVMHDPDTCCSKNTESDQSRYRSSVIIPAGTYVCPENRAVKPPTCSSLPSLLTSVPNVITNAASSNTSDF